MHFLFIVGFALMAVGFLLLWSDRTLRISVPVSALGAAVHGVQYAREGTWGWAVPVGAMAVLVAVTWVYKLRQEN
ncbi:hypothetical protein [Streptomyces himalayensis]|uniref:Uncharacterized protein n=1 Tax=Streptomyces himalayensis subsp. himalayensis TaxID=2756131 RepID=A0A7W0IDM8_9ACTN|nr:hypothetical protein [Streptomyces himalayensis]MBA2951467.1 hypothetical protein [Streptomyces himalayensis subsp. himalayensis]